jgi:hypothetical protein
MYGRYRIGAALLLGLLFHITPRLSLSTEPRRAAHYAYGRNESPEPDAESVASGGVLILSVHP